MQVMRIKCFGAMRQFVSDVLQRFECGRYIADTLDNRLNEIRLRQLAFEIDWQFTEHHRQRIAQVTRSAGQPIIEEPEVAS